MKSLQGSGLSRRKRLLSAASGSHLGWVTTSSMIRSLSTVGSTPPSEQLGSRIMDRTQTIICGRPTTQPNDKALFKPVLIVVSLLTQLILNHVRDCNRGQKQFCRKSARTPWTDSAWRRIPRRHTPSSAAVSLSFASSGHITNDSKTDGRYHRCLDSKAFAKRVATGRRGSLLPFMRARLSIGISSGAHVAPSPGRFCSCQCLYDHAHSPRSAEDSFSFRPS